MLSLEEDTGGYLLELGVEQDQAKEVLDYCSNRLCILDNENSTLPFCDGCELRTFAEQDTFDEDLYYEVRNDAGEIAKYSKDNGLEIFDGSITEYEAEEQGKEMWTIARHLLADFAQ